MIEWHGDALVARLRAAQKRGVDQIMSRCVKHAVNHHPWVYRTGVLEGSIRIVDYAAQSGDGVAGEWGSTDVVYARRLELGFSGTDARGRSYNQPPMPYLRPAADVHYPGLLAAVQRAWKRK